MSKIFALVDCNNFYASCEKVFNPSLNKKPLVVLSNNDGCIISRCPMAKAMNIKMGSPYFKIKDQFAAAGGIALSSNYPLYGDMSARVMSILSFFTPMIHVYSIDEAFLEFTGCACASDSGKRRALCLEIIQKVKQWTGLPVSIGLGPTKTLAKAATHFAKKRNLHAFSLLDKTLRHSALKKLTLSDIWGIGRRMVIRLNSLEIFTPLQLVNASPVWIRSCLGVNMQKTLNELNGAVSYPLFHDVTDTASVSCSRSFVKGINDIKHIESIISALMVRAVEKLREKEKFAGAISIFISTGNHIKSNKKPYSKGLSAPIDPPSNWEPIVLKKGLTCLSKIFKPGLDIKKAGVVLYELVDQDSTQLRLFSEKSLSLETPKVKALNFAVDFVNSKHGSGSLCYGIQQKCLKNMTDQKYLSANYTTSWSDIPIVKS